MITLNGFTGFTLLAVLVAMFGPSFPSLQKHFGVNEAQVGFSLTAHFIGTFMGTVSAVLLRRLVLRTRLLICSTLLLLGSLMIAFAPTWWLFIVAIALRGIGAGLYFTDINALFATGFGKRSAAMLGLVNAAYGAGSFIGPVVVGFFAGSHQVPFMIGILFSFLLLVLAWLSPDAETQIHSAERGFVAPYGLVALFMLMLFCSGSIENGLGAWMTTHFVTTGISTQAAANYTGMYWAAQTVGRVLMTPLALRLSPFYLLLVGFSLEAILLLVAMFSGWLVPAYVLCGLAVAPLFTSGLAWMASAMPGFRLVTIFGMAGSLMGAASTAPILGELIAQNTVRVLPLSLLVVTLVGLVVVLMLQGLTRKR